MYVKVLCKLKQRKQVLLIITNIYWTYYWAGTSSAMRDVELHCSVTCLPHKVGSLQSCFNSSFIDIFLHSCSLSLNSSSNLIFLKYITEWCFFVMSEIRTVWRCIAYFSKKMDWKHFGGRHPFELKFWVPLVCGPFLLPLLVTGSPLRLATQLHTLPLLCQAPLLRVFAGIRDPSSQEGEWKFHR